MLFRRLCFSISKSHDNPVFLSSLFTNPLSNSHSHSIFQSNFETLRLGFHRAFSAISNTPASDSPKLSTMDEPNRSQPGFSGRAEVFRALESSLGSSFSSQPIVPNPNPLIIVISGPSGVGKDAVIMKLREVRKDLHFLVTATSRPKRQGEIDGKDYFFKSKEDFLSMIEKNELLEYALVYGDYKGIPKQQIRECMDKGCDIVLRVDIQGAENLRGILGNGAVYVFVVAESEEALVRRLIGRKTETIEALVVRVASAKEELKHLDEFDYVVVNREGELEGSVKVLESIIEAEKARVQQRRAVI